MHTYTMHTYTMHTYTMHTYTMHTYTMHTYPHTPTSHTPTLLHHAHHAHLHHAHMHINVSALLSVLLLSLEVQGSAWEQSTTYNHTLTLTTIHTATIFGGKASSTAVEDIWDWGGKRFVCVHKHMLGRSGGMLPQENFMLWDCFWGHFWPKVALKLSSLFVHLCMYDCNLYKSPHAVAIKLLSFQCWILYRPTELGAGPQRSETRD